MVVKSIKEILSSKVISVYPETMATEAISIMGKNKISCVLIIKDKKPVGIFTERDVISIVQRNICLDDVKINELMSTPVTTTRDDIDILEAYNIILTGEIRHLAIVDSKGEAIGVVTQTDIINSLGPEFFVVFNKISNVMSRILVTVKTGQTVTDVISKMDGNHISCIIVDDYRRPIGILTERDVTRLLREKVKMEELNIEDAMSSPVYTICKNDQIQDAITIMNKKNIRRLTVVDKDGKLDGILTQFDIIKGLEPAHIKYLKSTIYEKNKKLRESEEKYRKLTETAQDAIISIDGNGIINVWNSLAENIFGYTKSEIIGKPVTTIIPERYRKEHQEGLERFSNTGIPKIIGKTVEVSGRTKEGGDVPIEMSLSFHEIGKKQYTFTAIIRDTTERKMAEEEIRKAKDEAEAANRAKSDFLANMSHEIRTPMNGVIGMTGLLLETELTAEQRDYAQTVRHSAGALLDIINDILDYSKIEAGKLSIEPVPFDLLIAIREVTELMTARAREKKIEILLRYTTNTPRYVIGDPCRIRQILVNLIGNAIKFTHEGHVLINVVCYEKDDHEAKLKLTVEDTGIGIPEDRLDAIFDKFTQAEASTTRKFGGTGLGLSISRQLVKMMGGSIGVASNQDKGSTFWFTLPLPLSKERSIVPIPYVDLADARVMVVDENIVSCRILHEILSGWGMQINVYESGEEALASLREAYSAGAPYHFTIIDHQVPRMDGEMLWQTIKNDIHLQETILIMLSSAGKRGDAKRFEQAGFAAYLTKPVLQSEIMNTLSIIWNAKKQGITTGLVTRYTLTESHAPKNIFPAKTKSSFHVRVLLAEDNIVNQKVAVQMLKKIGCNVDVAANGKEAVEMLANYQYDLIFMDCQMPEMDGYEATEEIRRMEGKDKHIPIIAMTAHAMKGERERCLKAGMNDYLSKPVEKEDLQNTLRQWTLKLEDGEKKNSKSLKTGEVTSSPIFDPSRVMEAVDGDINFARDIAETFLDDTSKKINKMREALSSNNLQIVECHAHSVKGSAANIRAGSFKEIAHNLELAGEAGNLDKAHVLFKELEMEYQKLKETLDQFDWKKEIATYPLS